MRSLVSIARYTLLFLTAVCLSRAFAPATSKSSQRISSTALRNQQPQRRFAQPKTKKYGGDAKLASKHAERIRTAGRRGTKRFLDPNKVFVGNLPFDTDEEQLSEFILDTMGQSEFILHSSKVISDWKTGKSKGYGFLVFTDPIYATVCMEVCNGKQFNGRAVSVSQGKKKDQGNQLYLKKKKKEPKDGEEAAIASALEDAESLEDDIPVFGDGVTDEDIELDAILFGLSEGEDDDEEEDDGIFLEQNFKSKFEETDPSLNREQRRDAARRLKRTKLPHKGFG